ncbi:unnamed protein product [Hymenolepis diminuta]|uniref:Uncharacterized protein n=1 Tax=Hymenolepis diminuta TaxID=6216 RepID=A0A564YJ08_HYMDI|nr:unnamed protein product [Hymenolepis diminuta]
MFGKMSHIDVPQFSCIVPRHATLHHTMPSTFLTSTGVLGVLGDNVCKLLTFPATQALHRQTSCVLNWPISHRSEKVSIPRMIVAKTPLSWLLLISPVCTIPSFSYDHPVQLKHAYNYILMRVFTQLTIIDSLPPHTHIHKKP